MGMHEQILRKWDTGPRPFRSATHHKNGRGGFLESEVDMKVYSFPEGKSNMSLRTAYPKINQNKS